MFLWDNGFIIFSLKNKMRIGEIDKICSHRY